MEILKLFCMKQILVPIDFSPASRNASQYAAALAKELGAELCLLHVYMIPVASGETTSAWAGLGKELVEEKDAHVSREIGALEDTYRIRVSGNAMIGMEAATIQDKAAEIGADLIVMGMKGGGRSKNLGSTTIATIRRSRIPVLVVPEGAQFTPLKKIALATDFDAGLNRSSFRSLMVLVKQFDASVQVVHVAEKAEAMVTSEIVGKMQLDVILANVRHSFHTVEQDDVEQGIDIFLHNHPVDLLVMVAHRHIFLERLFGHIYTQSTSYKTTVPLLVLEDK